MHVELKPKTLDNVVGQPCVRFLKDLAASPSASCWMLEGQPGVGKTASAHALATELGCHDEFTGKWHVPCTELGIDHAKELFGRTLRLRFGSESGFNVLILEECEWLSPACQRFLKDALDPLTRLPKNLIVVATSNDSSGLDEALLERFRLLAFSSGPHFREACLERLGVVWEQLTGNQCLPPSASGWGVRGERFSMRIAISNMTNALSGAARMQVA